MNKLTKFLTGGLLACASTLALAAPSELVVYNNTDHEARAYVHGLSKNPAPAHNELHLNWNILKLVCLYATVCDAEVKVETDTNNPIVLGNASINTSTGVVDVSKLKVVNGYKVSYLSPGKVRVDKN